MKEKNNKNLNISNSTDKSNNNKSKKSNKDNKNEKINETTLNDSKIDTTKNSISHSSYSSFQEKFNNSILNDSTYNNKESSASFITKYSFILNLQNLRIDVFNHYINNEFWIEIYSNEEHQGYAENFYELSRITNDSLPNIPFWGIIILSKNQRLDNEEIANIVNYFLQPQLPQIIYNL